MEQEAPKPQVMVRKRSSKLRLVLDVRKLRVLVAVADAGSIAGAARSLSFTPPAISQQIARLERETRQQLLERDRGRVRLTPTAEHLVRRARVLLADLDDAEREILSGPLDPPIIRIAAFNTALHALVPAVAARGKDVPAWSITERESDDALAALHRRTVDIVIAQEPAIGPPTTEVDLERTELGDEDLYLAVAATHEHAEANGQSLSLASLSDESWITPTPPASCHDLVHWAFTTAAIDPRIVAQCDDHRLVLRLVAGEVGVALVPRLALADIPRGVRIMKLRNPRVRRRLFVMHRRSAGAWLTHTAAELAEIISALNDDTDDVPARPGLQPGGV